MRERPMTPDDAGLTSDPILDALSMAAEIAQMAPGRTTTIIIRVTVSPGPCSGAASFVTDLAIRESLTTV